MGLDMYMYGVKSSFDKNEYHIGHKKECTEVGYWRKANHIHAWFVDNIQNGVDNCATYCVSPEALEELRKKCVEVLEKPELASEILPSRSGFFFGNTEYDEEYIVDLERTIEIIDWCLEQDFDYFEYSSSW